MNLAALQKAAAQAIVNIFETGSIRGNYGDVTLLRGDSGQLTYGRSQTTLASGNLFLLINDYAERSDGAYCAQFRPYLPGLEACDVSLNHNEPFRELLKDAGDDPVMHDVQDAFFDRVYWDPAMRSADALGVETALGAAIVYDSTVHGSWAHVRDSTRAQFGELAKIGEKAWMTHYVAVRRNWLATFPNPLLHKTVYRMDAFAAIIHANNWGLQLPIAVRGLTITADSLVDNAPVKVPAEGGPRRVLRLKTPPVTGPDVGWLQEHLTRAGIPVAASGSFDAATEDGVKTFQESRDLKVDGIVGPATRTALEDIPVIVPAASPAAELPMPSVIVSPPITLAPQIPTLPVEGQTMPDDAVTDIKKHVTIEVQSGVAMVRSSLQDEHQKLAQKIVETSGTRPATAAKASGVPSRAVLIKAISGKRTVAAAGVSAAVLALSEARDALVWVTGAPNAPSTPQSPQGLPQLPQGLPQLPQGIAALPQYVTQLLKPLQPYAASLPSDWVYRARIFALLLVCYALYRLVVRHINVGKLQSEIAQAQQLEHDVSGVLK